MQVARNSGKSGIVSGKVKVRVVGRVKDGISIGKSGVVNAQFHFRRQGISDGVSGIAREAHIHILLLIRKSDAVFGYGIDIPDAATKRMEAAM